MKAPAVSKTAARAVLSNMREILDEELARQRAREDYRPELVLRLAWCALVGRMEVFSGTDAPELIEVPSGK